MSGLAVGSIPSIRRADTTQRLWMPAALATLSGFLLALAYVDAALFPLAWIAFAPLLIATDGAGVRDSYRLGLVAGICFYTVAAPWIVDFIILFKGLDRGWSFAFAVLFWLYCAQLPALLFAAFAALRKQLPAAEWILFPLLVVAFYSTFPMLFSVQLGESQSAFLLGLQGVSLTGVYGLDFVIALTNVALFRAVLHWSRGEHPPAIQAIATLCILLSWFVYGWWSLDRWDEAASDWSSIPIGLIQPSDPPLLGSAPVYPGFSRAYPPEMEMTARLASAGAGLVIWPEGAYKHFLDDPRIGDAYAREAAALGVDILAQDIETVDANTRYNTAVLVQADGSRSPPYRKMKRVAFGEALPLVGALPAAEQLLKDYLGQFLRGIEAGRDRRVFHSGDLPIVPLICYEALFPAFAANGLPAEPAGTIFVAVSSNAWFGDSFQPHQHANASVLRAVENRVPLIHAINNGPSVAVLPSGRQILRSEIGEPGGYLVNLPHSPTSGGSFFTRHPHWFIGGAYLGLFTLILLAGWRVIQARR